MAAITRRSRFGRARRGTTAVEVAVTAPVILFLFFAFWEYGRCEMIRQTAAIAAFEGARQGTVAGATEADILDVVNNVLSRATLNDVDIDVLQQDASTTVNVKVPLDQNAWITPMYFRGMTIESEFELSNNR